MKRPRTQPSRDKEMTQCRLYCREQGDLAVCEIDDSGKVCWAKEAYKIGVAVMTEKELKEISRTAKRGGRFTPFQAHPVRNLMWAEVQGVGRALVLLAADQE